MSMPILASRWDQPWPPLRSSWMLGHLASLGRAADAPHGRENDAPVAPLQLHHELQVVADPEAPDRFLLQRSRTEPINQKLEWFWASPTFSS